MTNEQLDQIKQDFFLVSQNKTLSELDLFEIVKKHCPDTGKYRYRGVDTSDLITLLKLATKK